MKPSLALIAAVGRNNVIGHGPDIPWRLPSDQQFFKRITMGKPIIMGRKTFETFKRPLPGRTSIVVTRQLSYQPEGVLTANSLEKALTLAEEIARRDQASEIFVIGGGDLYAQAIGIAKRLYITHVNAEPAGDVVFPQIDPAEWTGFTRSEYEADPADSTDYTVRVYERA